MHKERSKLLSKHHYFCWTLFTLLHALSGSDLLVTSHHRLLGDIDTATLTKVYYANADTFICRMCSDTHNIMIKPTWTESGPSSINKAADNPSMQHTTSSNKHLFWLHDARMHISMTTSLTNHMASGGFNLNNNGVLTPLMTTNERMLDVLGEAIPYKFVLGSCNTQIFWQEYTWWLAIIIECDL